MIRALVLCFLFVTAAQVHAQYVSTQGTFEADEVKGCVPFTVNITILPPEVCDMANPCNMDFEGNGTYENLTFSHTYTKAGSYSLKVLINNSKLDDLLITVTPDIQPAFEIYACASYAAQYKITDTNYDQYAVNFNDLSPIAVVPSGSMAMGTHSFGTAGSKTITVHGRNLLALDNCSPANQSFNAVLALTAPTLDVLTVVDPTQIQLDFTSQQYVQYKLEVARNSNAPFQFLQTVYNVNTVTIANLKTETEYYCFRLGAYDPCNNTTTYSNTVCSADVDLNIQNNVNALSWRTSPSGLIPNAGFELLRDGVAYPSMPSTAMTFNDVDVVCNTNYCYQLINHYVNGSTSYSLPMCGKAFSTTTPTAIQDVTTAIDGNTVAITWLQDPAFAAADYRISKSVDGSPFVPVLTSATPAVTDPNYLNGTPTCYSINYTDQCGNASGPRSEACVITLAAALQSDNVVNLSWNAYEGWKNGVKNYTVERYSASGTLLQSYSTGTTNMFVDNAPDVTNQLYVYVITAEGNDANLGFSISNAVTVIKDPNLFYPSAFTPHNRDGLNDLFVVFGQYITEFNMKIFNRWGELMFTTTNINAGWDGRYKGVPMPEDTYVFVATLTDFSGRTFNRSGSVLLLNK